MEHALAGSLVRYRAVMEELERAYPGLDDETLRDTVEGETDLVDHITRVIRSRREDLAMAAALKDQMAEMRERLERPQGPGRCQTRSRRLGHGRSRAQVLA